MCSLKTIRHAELYLNLLPPVNAGACSLLDDDRLVRHLTSLERRVSPGVNRDNIDQPPGTHDNLANADAGSMRRSPDRPQAAAFEDGEGAEG